jgi:hypothetical protein
MVVDFTHLESRGKVDNAAKILCHFANARGWLYRET